MEHNNCKHAKVKPPFIGSSVYSYTNTDIENAFNMINKVRLFKIGFGYNDKHDENKQKELLNNIAIKEYESMKDNILINNLIEPVLIISYYNTIKDSDNFYIVDDNNNKHKLPLDTINSKSIADFFDSRDIISLIFSSLGTRYNEYIQKLYNNNEYKKYYFYHILGTYIVDSFQDILQREVYNKLDLEKYDDSGKILKGERFSFGYSALRDLSGNKIIYDILSIKDYSIKLTDSYMFEPELSTAAIVSFCKYAHYFSN